MTGITHPAPFRFDGHGVNDANGRRIGKVSINPYKTEDWTPENSGIGRNPEFDRLSNLFAASADLQVALTDLIADLERLAPDFAICAEILKSSYGKAARQALKKAKGKA